MSVLFLAKLQLQMLRIERTFDISSTYRGFSGRTFILPLLFQRIGISVDSILLIPWEVIIQ